MMKPLTGLIGREDLVEKIAREARKGRHLLLVGPVGIGKSAVLEAALDRLLVRQARVVLHVHDHQAKGQFLELARGLLEAGLLKPSALELDPRLDDLDPAALEWTKLRRSVNRLSIRDLTAALVPALHAHPGRVLIAVDDLTAVTPTLVAFWLAILDAAQILACASAKKPNVAKLWWKLAEIEIPPLAPEHARAIAQTYLTQTGTLVESPPLFLAHVVQQANGNPQALADLLADASKERLVDKARIREMRHAAGIRYLDFTPVLLVGARYLAGFGDRRALSGHRHRRHRPVRVRRDAGRRGPVGPGVPGPGRGQGELAGLPTHLAFASALYLGGAALFGYRPDAVGWALAAVASLLPDVDLPTSKVGRLCWFVARRAPGAALRPSHDHPFRRGPGGGRRAGRAVVAPRAAVLLGGGRGVLVAPVAGHAQPARGGSVLASPRSGW
jgi:energy-coupling factor transporter ATP-binding protein EcfA2